MTSSVKQIPLDLNFRPAYRREDLFVGDSNRNAIAMIDAWPNWNAPALIVYGEEGSGKQHLGAVWQQMSDALVYNASEFAAMDITTLIDNPRNIVIHQLHLLAGDAEQEEKLFHLYNKYFLAKTNSILFTSRTAPNRLALQTKDLLSRLTSCPHVYIDLPSEDLIQNIIGKQLYDHGMIISSDTLRYASTLIGRSWRLAKLFVANLHEYNLTHKKPITQKLIRDILIVSEQQDS
jgi:chromosomal replication initiation ATPase DnaA